MDNFIYSVPNYTFDWSKYIYPIPHTINPKTELFNFLNIIESPTNNILHINTNTDPTLNLNKQKLTSSKFAKTVRSNQSY